MRVIRFIRVHSSVLSHQRRFAQAEGILATSPNARGDKICTYTVCAAPYVHLETDYQGVRGAKQGQELTVREENNCHKQIGDVINEE